MATADPRSERKNLTIRDVRLIQELREKRHLPHREVAEIVGCSPTAVRNYAPGRPGQVSNKRLREVFRASGLTATEVATRLNWTYRVDEPRGWRVDGYRVKRVLGISPCNGRYRSTVDWATALALTGALGVELSTVLSDEGQVAA